MGELIVLEGCNGSGKSTNARLFAGSHENVVVMSDWDTALGVELKKIFRQYRGVFSRVQHDNIINTARQAQLHVLKEELAKGKTVLYDRNILSSFVYGRMYAGAGDLEGLIDNRIHPKHTIFFDAPTDFIANRKAARAGVGVENIDTGFINCEKAYYEEEISDNNDWLNLVRIHSTLRDKEIMMAMESVVYDA